MTTDATKRNGGLDEVGTTSRGYTIFRERNEVGGHRYWSDEIGGGVVVWDTCLADSETLRRCLEIEAALAHTPAPPPPPAESGEDPWREAGEKQVQVHEALRDSAYRAGARAGWNAQFAPDPDAAINLLTRYEKGALAIIHEKRLHEARALLPEVVETVGGADRPRRHLPHEERGVR